MIILPMLTRNQIRAAAASRGRFRRPTLMTMYLGVDCSTSNMTGYRKLRCSRSKYLRCAPRFLVSRHLLGPESRTIEPLLEEVAQNEQPWWRSIALKHSRRRILHASENSVAHVLKHVRCAPRFLVSRHLLGPESRTIEPLLEEVAQNEQPWWRSIALKHSRRRILHASENSVAHVLKHVRCAPRFLVSRHLLGPLGMKVNPH